jgi:tetratricopeptide (TPR) repeat protein
LQAQKKSKEAIAVAVQLTKTKPSSVTGWTLLSRLYLTGQQYKEALVPAKTAYDLQSNNPEFALIYAIVLELNKRSKDAVGLYEQLYRINPANEELTERMVALYSELGNLDIALQILEDLEKQTDEPKPGISIQKVLLLWRMEKFSEASATLANLAKLYPESDRVQYMSGLGHERIKELDKAIERYASIPKESSLWLAGQLRTAFILKIKKDYERASQVLESLQTQKLPEELAIEVWALQGDILVDQDKTQEATSHYDEGTRRFPKQTSFLFLRGVFEEKLGNISAAEHTMRAVIKLDPSNAAAYNFLGYMLAEKGERLDEAESLIRKALTFKPDDGFYLDSLGWVFFQRKDFKKAIEVLTLALKKSPDEGVIMEHLADALLAIGQQKEAKELYEHAMKTQLEQRDRTRIESKYKTNFKP